MLVGPGFEGPASLTYVAASAWLVVSTGAWAKVYDTSFLFSGQFVFWFD